LTASLLIGAVPAVLLGARFSAVASPRLSRPVMAAVLAGSAAALLHAPTPSLWAGAALSGVLVGLLGGRPAISTATASS
ncbi:MAG: hypothetical protein M0Z51_13300, partial [Propionibacterium sp.]|nr:hypothetical protein [Propionibacterium sp.]